MASKAEINRLGDALRDGNLTTENLIALDEYRRSFQPAMANVIAQWQQFLGFPEILVQRPSKATPSIIAKLRRQPTLKLTQIQDIAGLRVWLSDRIDTLEQSALNWSVKHDILKTFGRTTPFDVDMKLIADAINEIYKAYLPD